MYVICSAAQERDFRFFCSPYWTAYKALSLRYTDADLKPLEAVTKHSQTELQIKEYAASHSLQQTALNFRMTKKQMYKYLLRRGFVWQRYNTFEETGGISKNAQNIRDREKDGKIRRRIPE